MAEIVPSKLYKYQQVNEDPNKNYSFKNLREKKLWFSNPENFNDPFDCNVNFEIIDDHNDENLRSLFLRLLELALDKNTFRSKYSNDGKINKAFRSDAVGMARAATKSVVSRKQFGVSCFAENNENILMWSHYASNHQGFCLEFDTRFEPFKPVKTQTLLKVDYSEKYPRLSINNIPNNLPSIPRNIFGIKSTHWSYEEEWRMFASPGGKSYPFDPLALIGIYFGCKMTDNDKHELAKILRDFPSVKLYQMQRSESEFKVVSQEIFTL